MKLLAGNRFYKDTQIPKAMDLYISPLGREFYIVGGIDTHVPIKFIDKNEYIKITKSQFEKCKKINI
jgi:hypothetical protein